MRLSSERDERHSTVLCKGHGRGELAVGDGELSARAVGAAADVAGAVPARASMPNWEGPSPSSHLLLIRRLITPLSLPNPTPRVFAGS